MPNVVKITIKDRFSNKLIALKLKEDTTATRVTEILANRYEHLQGKELALYLRGEELPAAMTLNDLITQKGYTEKEKIEIGAPKPSQAKAAPAGPGPQDFVQMMGEGGAKFDTAIMEILVETQALHRNVAKMAWASAKQKNRSFATTVIEEAYLTEKDILTNVSRYLEIPSVDLEGVSIAPEVLDLIPEKEAQYYCVIPIRLEKNTLFLATPNPFDNKKLHDLRLLTGLNIEPQLSTEVAIQAKIKQLYPRMAESLEGTREESPLPDELFSVNEGQNRKKPTLMIKEGKKVQPDDIKEEEFQAPTLCGDKSDEFLLQEPEAESKELAYPAAEPAVPEDPAVSPENNIWHAPTLVGRKDKFISPVDVEEQEIPDGGLAIPAEAESIDIPEFPPKMGQEAPEEPVSQDNIPPGGDIPVFAGFQPGEVPQAIEIFAEGAGENEDESFQTDLMKTERMQVGPGAVNAAPLEEEEEESLRKQLERELGISPEELELEKAVRTEKIDPARVSKPSGPFSKVDQKRKLEDDIAFGGEDISRAAPKPTLSDQAEPVVVEPGEIVQGVEISQPPESGLPVAPEEPAVSSSISSDEDETVPQLTWADAPSSHGEGTEIPMGFDVTAQPISDEKVAPQAPAEEEPPVPAQVPPDEEIMPQATQSEASSTSLFSKEGEGRADSAKDGLSGLPEPVNIVDKDRRESAEPAPGPEVSRDTGKMDYGPSFGKEEEMPTPTPQVLNAVIPPRGEPILAEAGASKTTEEATKSAGKRQDTGEPAAPKKKPAAIDDARLILAKTIAIPKQVAAKDALMAESAEMAEKDRELREQAPVEPRKAPKKRREKISRNLTARHYRKMYPFRTFPLWVIFSKAELPKALPQVAEVKGERVVVEAEASVVKVVPSVPGCLTVPSEVLVDIAPGTATARMWITPLSEGKIEDARVEIWSGERLLQTLPLAMQAGKQWPAKVAMVFGVLAPLLGFFYDVSRTSILEGCPPLLQKTLLYVHKCATPFQGMFNFGLILGSCLLIVALILFFLRKTSKAQPVVGSLEVSD